MSVAGSLNVPSVPPPTKKKLVVKDSLNLLFELLWLIFIVMPYQLLLSVFKKVFPHPGKPLKNQVVIVTGAGRGLGRGLALRFGKEGAKVAVVDIDISSANKTAQDIVDQGGTAKSYFTNVGSIKDIHQLQISVTEDLGPVDILVNNAGIIHIESIVNLSEAEVRSVLEINLLSHFWMVQEFLPAMKSRNSGHIVAICSLSAIAGVGNGTAYVASKSGVMGFMDSLRTELNSNPTNNIKTTTVLPYFINTSEHYVNLWDIRLPPLSIEEVTEATIIAVKQDVVILTVPKRTLYVVSLFTFLPIEIRDKFFSIMYTRMTTPTKENKDVDPSQRLINELSKKRQE